MKTELIHLLACPACGGDLNLRIQRGTQDYIEQGALECPACKKEYAIREDIPFFAPQVLHAGVHNQQETYSIWWDKYHDETSVTAPHLRDYFYNSLRLKASEIEGRVMLDAGCGNGRFSFVTSYYRPKLLVSFDISSGLVHAKKTITKYNPSANVAYVQGNLTAPPFKKGAFDIVFSWGVIHHTPKTERTFSGISALVKKGGKLAIYVYEFHPLYNFTSQFLSLIAYLRQFLLIRPLRYVCSRLPAKMVHALFIPVYYLERLFNFGIVGCHGNGTDKWNKKLYFSTVIDRFKTRYASEHQQEEVIQWFKNEGYNRLELGFYPKVSISGTKAAESKQVLDIQIATAPLKDETIQGYLGGNLQKTA